jgi:hypothetical protein
MHLDISQSAAQQIIDLFNGMSVTILIGCMILAAFTNPDDLTPA